MASADEPLMDRGENPPNQHPHIYRPIPRRSFDPHIPHDTADSPTHAFSQQPQPHSPTASSLQSSRSSDFLAQLNARLLRTYNARADDAPESPVDSGPGSARLPRQNKSFLNMNSSTLFGIYDDVGVSTHGAASVADTPWGTGAETPGHTAMGWNGGSTTCETGPELSVNKRQQQPKSAAAARRPSAKDTAHRRRRSTPPRRPRTRTARHAVLAAKLAALFTFGVLYGTIVSHLHDTRHLAAVHVRGVVDRESWFYMSAWGSAGVALGSLLPWVDLVWSRHSNHSSSTGGLQQGSSNATEEDNEDGGGDDVVGRDKDAESPISEQINDVVRSVAAFVGVAFAIRRLPWQSTLQLTLTLALVNPALWYILDRSKPGLSCSLIVTSLLTSLIFLSTPTALPSPHLPSSSPAGSSSSANATLTPSSLPPHHRQDLFAGLISYDNLAVVTWVGSVLFCSCVCFGSIGRRLGVWEGGWRR